MRKRSLLVRLLAVCLIPFAVLAMPAYNAGSPIFLTSGNAVQVWNAETPTPGNGTTAASQQVSMVATNGRAGTPFSVDGKFSGAPGAFECDVQVATIDADANYQTISNGNITTVDSVSNTFHLDAVLVNARFARLLMRSRTNSVSVTAYFTGG
jgi:hypothetical protein